jgi:hypothetical protein
METFRVVILLCLSCFVTASVHADDKTKAEDLVTPEMTDERDASKFPGQLMSHFM